MRVNLSHKGTEVSERTDDLTVRQADSRMTLSTPEEVREGRELQQIGHMHVLGLLVIVIRVINA